LYLFKAGLLMIDYTNLWLTLAISFQGNFHTRREEISL